MKNLAVIDLDNTLVSLDTMRLLIKKNFSLALVRPIILRGLKLISRENFSESIHLFFKKKFSDQSFLSEFVDQVYSKIDYKILNLIEEKMAQDDVIILLSASPKEYVELLAKKLSWNGYGSYWDGGKYFHCYAENKLHLVSKIYSYNEYTYKFAVSDSKSDVKLLNMFHQGYLYVNQELLNVSSLKLQG